MHPRPHSTSPGPATWWARRLHREERGEGVISSAIAVLVMAFLGAAMWLAFQGMFATATDTTRTQVELIGR